MTYGVTVMSRAFGPRTGITGGANAVPGTCANSLERTVYATASVAAPSVACAERDKTLMKLKTAAQQNVECRDLTLTLLPEI